MFANHSRNTTLFLCEMAIGPPTAAPLVRPADLSSTSGFLGTPPRSALAPGPGTPSSGARGTQTPGGGASFRAPPTAAEPASACSNVLCAFTTDFFPRAVNSRRPLAERVELLPFRKRCFDIAFVPDAYGLGAELDCEMQMYSTSGRYVAITSDSVFFFEKLTPQQVLENVLAVPLNSDLHLRTLREMMTPEQLAITALLLGAIHLSESFMQVIREPAAL